MRNYGLIGKTMKLKQLFKRHKSRRFIHYSEPNQEPHSHIAGKKRVRELLNNFDYILLDNMGDGHNEYLLPPLVTPYIAQTEEERIRQYQIDCLMYNPQLKKIIAVEVDGPYHNATREARKHTRLKRDTIEEYLGSNNEIRVGKHRYQYDTFKVFNIEDEVLVGKYAIDRLELMVKLLN